MRIVIAGSPKCGNVWLKCLLSKIYDLQWLGRKDRGAFPARDGDEPFIAWINDGKFEDGTIFHRHFSYTTALANALVGVPAHVVTIVRDPYDTFVSTYSKLQEYHEANAENPRIGRPSDALLGKPLDHPEILAYLKSGGFRGILSKGTGWVEAARGPVVRYEDLQTDPIAALERATADIDPVARDRIAAAVEACSADAMRKDPKRRQHVRTATVGESRQRLTEAHLEIFRARHADLIQTLGYPVR